MYLATILTHKKFILDQSHRIAAKISPGLTGILNLFITKDTIDLTLLDQLFVNFVITHYYILYLDFLSLSVFTATEPAHYQRENPLRGGHKLHATFLRMLNWTHI